MDSIYFMLIDIIVSFVTVTMLPGCRYMYCDTVGLQSCYQALGLCYAASKYMLNHLVERCVDFLCCHLDSTSVWRALELANMLDESKLRNKCISVSAAMVEKIFTNLSTVFLQCTVVDHHQKVTQKLSLYFFNNLLLQVFMFNF